MLSWLASFLTGSVLDKALDGWKATVAARTNADTLASQLTVEAFKADIERRRIDAGSGLGWLAICVLAFAIPTAVYYGIVLFGLITGLGSVQPVRDPMVAEIMKAVVNYVLPGGVGLKALSMAMGRLGKR